MLGLIEPFTWLYRMQRAGRRTSMRGSSPNNSPRSGVSKSSLTTKAVPALTSAMPLWPTPILMVIHCYLVPHPLRRMALYTARSITDLSPVSLVARLPYFVFVPNSSPAKTVPAFVDYVKAQPGKFIMASPGTGSGPHLAELLFLQMAGIQMTHAPYRDAAPAFTDLIPGRVHCYFGSGELLTYSRSGQIRVLASTGAKRSPAAPEVPTIAESAIPGYVVDAWQGVFAPAKTPPAIVQKISGDLAKALVDPALVEKLARNAYTVESSSPEELAKFLKADTEKWEAVIKTTGIKID